MAFHLHHPVLVSSCTALVPPSSVEIRWPMLTSYIICIFFHISSPIIFPFTRTITIVVVVGERTRANLIMQTFAPSATESGYKLFFCSFSGGDECFCFGIYCVAEVVDEWLCTPFDSSLVRQQGTRDQGTSCVVQMRLKISLAAEGEGNCCLLTPSPPLIISPPTR